MDRTRCKRPSDVNEALSSMLWTPYDDAASTSISTDGLTDDERRKGERKFHRYSNPLPDAMNWSNSHASCSQSMTMKYSFSYYGNCFPSDVSPPSATTTKRTVSRTINERNYGQTFNTSMFEPTIVRSFTDDFYHYQNHKYECQSTYKNYKSQPLIQFDSLLYPSSSNEIIDKHFEAPSIASTTITTENYGDKLFNQQMNKMLNTEGNKWQHRKVGNMGDLYSYVHKGSVKKQEKSCTNTTLNAEEKSRKVTQPPNVIQSYSTLNSRNNKLSGNEYMDQEENCAQTQTKAISKTLLSDSMVAKSRASRSEDSNECRVLDPCGDNRRDVDKYRLFQKNFTKSEDMNDSDSQVSSPQTGLHLHQKIELMNGAEISVLYDKTDDDCNFMRNKKQEKSSRSNESGNKIVQCLADIEKIENVDDCNNHHKFSIIESANSGVESILRDSSRQIAHDTARVYDNVTITSAVENLLSDEFVKSRAHNKTKYSNDSFSLREKRRRNRRDRRQARVRTFSTNEILPDIINNHLPPPYADVPLQVIVPSINSTVPVADSQFSFSLPLVRRSASDRYGKDCCDQWFNGPPLRFLVALVALGGVACTLGGATLGSIALAGSPTSHLTAGLLMTGVGIVLVTISGIAWRMTTSDNPQCTGRRQCTRGNSSFGLLYPEFQHRPPPPSYQNSIQQNRFREMIQNRERHAAITRVSPPPTYHSNAGTFLSPPTSFPSNSTPNYAQTEAILDNFRTSVNNVDATSATFPQTIKTITLISRLNDNELDELVLTSPDEASLISKSSKINNIKDGKIRSESIGNEDSDDCRLNGVRHKNLKFIRVRSSDRCLTDTSSDSFTNYNGNVVSTLDHNNHAYVKNCKNVHSGIEFNKTMLPITRSSSSTCDPMTIRDGDCFVNVES